MLTHHGYVEVVSNNCNRDLVGTTQYATALEKAEIYQSLTSAIVLSYSLHHSNDENMCAQCSSDSIVCLHSFKTSLHLINFTKTQLMRASTF